MLRDIGGHCILDSFAGNEVEDGHGCAGDVIRQGEDVGGVGGIGGCIEDAAAIAVEDGKAIEADLAKGQLGAGGEGGAKFGLEEVQNILVIDFERVADSVVVMRVPLVAVEDF